MIPSRAYYVLSGASRQAVLDYHEARRAWLKEALDLAFAVTGQREAFVQDNFGQQYLYYLAGEVDKSAPEGTRVDRKVNAGLGKMPDGSSRYLLTPAKKTKRGKDLDMQISALNKVAPKLPCDALGLSELRDGVFVGGSGFAIATSGQYGGVVVLSTPLRCDGKEFAVPTEAQRLAQWEFHYLVEHKALPASEVAHG